MNNLMVLLICFFITPLLFSQNEEAVYDEIPENLIGSWVIEELGEGQIPSQIFRWKFSKLTQKTCESEFHWLFKRQEDSDYITVAVLVSDLHVKGDKFFTKTKKAGSMQKEPGKMEFYGVIKWHLPGDDLFEKYPKEGSNLFKIKGDVLILQEDHNGDGDFEDEGETQKYMKEISNF